MKQTAVDFLYSEYKRIFGEIEINVQDALKIADSLGKAKEMEKQQIIDAYDDGNYAYGMGIKEPEQYYDETFKK
jgi:hypothetical protein